MKIKNIVLVTLIASVFLLGSQLSDITLFGADLPLDKDGRINWVKMVEDELISPQWELKKSGDDEELDETIILFESKSDKFDDVLFKHEVHTYWLSCPICHETKGGVIFEQGAGENKVLMKEMKTQKKWCGRCHSTVAFPLSDCNRCHNLKKGTKRNEDWSIRSNN